MFADTFEAVVGAQVARAYGLEVGQQIITSHGLAGRAPRTRPARLPSWAFSKPPAQIMTTPSLPACKASGRCTNTPRKERSTPRRSTRRRARSVQFLCARAALMTTMR